MDDGAALGERQNGKVPAVETAEAAEAARPSRLMRLPMAWTLWGTFVVALALYLLFGRATVENGILTGTPVWVTTLWGQFSGLLRAWGFGDALVAIVWALGAAGLLLSVAAVWFAFAARDDPDPTA
ncbi:MAG TPA: hypothetical protein VFU81_12355 [Thermomicrobiales bacterium]|nr:hypothetical protein [Thermomicrobiales bacterium]